MHLLVVLGLPCKYECVSVVRERTQRVYLEDFHSGCLSLLSLMKRLMTVSPLTRFVKGSSNYSTGGRVYVGELYDTDLSA